MKNVIRLTACLLILVVNSTVLQAQWESAGGIPAYNFGSIGSAGKWIIASGFYGFDRPVSSTDGGESWSSNSGLGTTVLSPVLVTTPGDTFALAVGYGNSIFCLRDTAKAWVRSDSGLGGAQVRQMAYVPGTGFSSDGVVVAVSPLSGVFRSTDLGAHWSASDSGLTRHNAVAAVAINSTFLVATDSGGVFRSEDQGVTWSPSSIGLEDTTITVLATSSGKVFAASGRKIFQSSDEGTTWTLIPESAPEAMQNLVVVPTPGRGIGAALFAVTATGHYRLSANDSSWVFVRPRASQIMDVWCTLTAVDTVLYAVDYNQINCSSDLGNKWFQEGNGTSGEIHTGHRSSRQHHPNLYSGPFASANFGSKWLSMHSAYDEGSHVAVISVSPDTSALGFDRLTIGTDSGAVEFSDDGGQTWKVVHERQWWARGHGCADVAELDGVIFASLQGDNPYHHYSGDTVSGVYRTTTAGGTWEKMNTAGLTDTLVLSLDVFRGKDGGRVLFAGTWYNLFRSTNDGESWTADSSVRSGRKILREVNGTLFLCTGGTMLVGYDNEGNIIRTVDTAGVYRSTDEGVTWIEVNGDLHPPGIVRGFAAATRLQDPGRAFLAVSMDGTSSLPTPYAQVLTSTQGGKQWRAFTDNLPRSTSGAPMGADDQFVYSMGMRRPWTEAELTSAGPEQSFYPMTFSLNQNYPNPFNPTTTISYSVPHRTHVTLTVFNILGQKVADIINADINAGYHSVQFDGSGLASGVYFYRLQAGAYAVTKKLLLIR